MTYEYWAKAQRAYRPRETGIRSSCITHRLGDLAMHKSAVAQYPDFSHQDLDMLTSMDWRHGVSYKGFVSTDK